VIQDCLRTKRYLPFFFLLHLFLASNTAWSRDTPRARLGLMEGPVGVGPSGRIWFNPYFAADLESTFFLCPFFSILTNHVGVSARLPLAEGILTRHDLTLRVSFGGQRTHAFDRRVRWDETYGADVGYAYLSERFEWSFGIGAHNLELEGREWLPGMRFGFGYLLGSQSSNSVCQEIEAPGPI
jgi:hypothetical protein